jgi:hypothetical protein
LFTVIEEHRHNGKGVGLNDLSVCRSYVKFTVIIIEE